MYLCTCITRYCCWLAQSLILVCGPRSCQMCSFPAWGTWGMGELAWTERAISFNGSVLCPAVLPLGSIRLTMEILGGLICPSITTEIYNQLINQAGFSPAITLQARVWASYVYVDLCGAARNRPPVVGVSALQSVPLWRAKAVKFCLLTDRISGHCNSSLKIFGSMCFGRCPLKIYS